MFPDRGRERTTDAWPGAPVSLTAEKFRGDGFETDPILGWGSRERAKGPTHLIAWRTIFFRRAALSHREGYDLRFVGEKDIFLKTGWRSDSSFHGRSVSRRKFRKNPQHVDNDEDVQELPSIVFRRLASSEWY